MKRRALRIVLGVVGVIFLASGYPGVVFLREDPALSMMFSLYVTLGVFLLLAIRNPSEHRSLIAFTAWSSFAHAAVMGFQAMRGMVAHVELIGVVLLLVIGILLIALAPGRGVRIPSFAKRRMGHPSGFIREWGTRSPEETT